VAAYEKLLELTRNRYNAGVVSRVDIAQAETQLNSARAQTLDLGVQRAQLEHAIAVLLGTPAPGFSLAAGELAAPPRVPAAGVPADLLERRPTSPRPSAASRRPTRRSASPRRPGSGRHAHRRLRLPDGELGAVVHRGQQFWSVGAALALTLIDGGRRAAVSDQAIASYDQTVANYRGTALTAFAEVEDNLAALRILEAEAAVQDDTCARRSCRTTSP